MVGLLCLIFAEQMKGLGGELNMGHMTRFTKSWPLSSAAHLCIILAPVCVGMAYISFETLLLSKISKSCIYRAPLQGVLAEVLKLPTKWELSWKHENPTLSCKGHFTFHFKILTMLA